MDISFEIYDDIPLSEDIFYDLELRGENRLSWQLESADHDLFSQPLSPNTIIENEGGSQAEINTTDEQLPQFTVSNASCTLTSCQGETCNAQDLKSLEDKSNFECSLCGKSFAQKSSCNRHKREIHLRQQSFHCHKCGIRFSKKYNLQMHEKRAHAQDRPKNSFKCSYCSCNYSNKAAVLKHIKDYHLKTQSQADGDFQEYNPQRDAENVLQQLKLLQKDIEESNVYQKKQSPHELCITANEAFEEVTLVDESQVDEVIITDRLYPFGEFKELKVQQIKRDDGSHYLICEFCGKEFKKSYGYLRHRRTHCRIRPFICVICKKSFPTQNQLRRHCTTHTIKKENGIRQRGYKCPKCFETELTINDFDRHLSSHLPCTIIAFQCQNCSKLFQTLKSFVHHKHQANDAELNMLKSLLPLPICLVNGKKTISDSSASVNETFTCSLCGLKMSCRVSLRQHEKRHSNLRKYQCHICNKYYSSNASLEVHKRIHLEFYNFKCLKCSKVFKTNYQLQRHALRHSSTKIYKCRYCERIFKTSQYCRSHMLSHLKRLIHTDNIYQQDEKLISIKTILRHNKNDKEEVTEMHVLKNKTTSKTCSTQNQKKKIYFKCAKCPLEFRYKSWLKKHNAQTHSPERPYQCKTCLKSFRKNQVLKTHLLTHEDERIKELCLVCGKKYSSKKSLNVHLRLHTETKPFDCEVCQKSFRTSGHLIQHRKANHR